MCIYTHSYYGNTFINNFYMYEKNIVINQYGLNVREN